MEEYLVITEKGRALMNLMSYGVILPRPHISFGEALYALDDDYDAMPWIIKGCLREGYLTHEKDVVTEQADEILLEATLKKRK